MSGQVVGVRDQISDMLESSSSPAREGNFMDSERTVVEGGGRNERSGLALEEGVLSKVKPELGHVFLMAEESPYFLLLLGMTAWDSVSCCCPHGASNWLIRDNPAPWRFKDSLRDLATGANSVEGKRRTFLIQAESPKFTSETLAAFHELFDSSTDQLLVVCSFRLRKHPPWSNWYLRWINTSHCHVGGVTNKRFSIGMHSSTEDTLDNRSGGRSRVQRFVKGIQKVDVGGDECSSPELAVLGSKDTLLDSASHVTPAELLGTFRLKSVFSKSSWVARKLTTREVGAAWDLPPDRVKKLEAEVLLGGLSLPNLIRFPPLKVLQEAMSLLFPMELISELGETKDSSLASDDVFKLSTFIPETTIQEVKASHSKAVKNDDAATETEMWDKACIAGFDPIQEGVL